MINRLLTSFRSYIDSWSVPMPSIVEALNQGYQSGMESGDIEHAFLCLAASKVYQYTAGQSLESTLEETDHTMGLMNQYKVVSVAAMFQYQIRALSDLTGKTEDPLDWASEETTPPPKRLKDFSVICQLVWRYLCRLQVAYYLGEFDLAYRVGEYFGVVEEADKSHCTVSHGLFFRVLAATAMYRKRRKRIYRTKALKRLRQMRVRMENTSINNLHRFYIMEADVNATFGIGKRDRREMFDNAISTSTKAGFLQDAALANELAGEYFLSKGDDFWAKHYLTCSYSLYLTWEASAKTKQLLMRYPRHVDADSALKDVHRNRKSRKEVTMSAIAMHQTIDTGRKSSLASDHGSSLLHASEMMSFESASRLSITSSPKKASTIS